MLTIRDQIVSQEILSSPTGALAVIPARGGSKGIPNKNLALVGGQSLVARCVTAAMSSRMVGRVVVSTDDDAIAAEAEKYRAEVVRRPKEIAGDTASSESALLHTLNYLEELGPLPERLVFLQCTSPFTTGTQIDKVLEALETPQVHSSFAVTPWHGFLWHENGEGINHNPLEKRKRRQDLEPTYLETGSIYAMEVSAFRQNGSRFCAPWRPVIINEASPEIDTPEDLKFCRQLAQI